jgi:hypothetical protein
VRVSAFNASGDGLASVLDERVGTVPDQPAITSSFPRVFGATLRVAGNTWTLPRQAVWDIRSTAPDGTNDEVDGDSLPELLNAYQRGTYVVRVRVRNAVGASAWSAPADVTVIAAPSAPRHLAASALGSPVRLSWSPPVTDGGSAVTGYAVAVVPYPGSAGRTYHTSSTSLVLGDLPSGRLWSWSVSALNEATAVDSRHEEPADGPTFDTGTLGLVATTASGTARWLGPGATEWQALGTRSFATPPTPLKAWGRTYLLGSTPTGAVLMRTLGGRWHHLSSVPSYDAAAQVGHSHRLWVACRSGDGTLDQLRAYLPETRLPTQLRRQTYVAHPRIVGAPTIARDRYGDVRIAYRSPNAGSHGYDVRVVVAGTDATRYVALDCPSRPMIATTVSPAPDGDALYAVACRVDRRHVAWARIGFADGDHSRGMATLPFSIEPNIAVGYPAARVQVLTRSADGVRRYDVRSGTWAALGGAFASSLTAATWSL